MVDLFLVYFEIMRYFAVIVFFIFYLDFFYIYIFLFFFFFFQAEDGIRDRNVTGVQTCALPIYFAAGPGGISLPGPAAKSLVPRFQERNCRLVDRFRPLRIFSYHQSGIPELALRSEERRVGKECRSRWGTERGEKKRQGR